MDADVNRVTIERAADGTPEAIVAPGGQRTLLTVDTNGFLSSVTNPAGEVRGQILLNGGWGFTASCSTALSA